MLEMVIVPRKAKVSAGGENRTQGPCMLGGRGGSLRYPQEKGRQGVSVTVSEARGGETWQGELGADVLSFKGLVLGPRWH